MYIQVKIKQKACVDVLNEVTKLKAIGNLYKLFFENFYTSNMPFAIFRLDGDFSTPCVYIESPILPRFISKFHDNLIMF